MKRTNHSPHVCLAFALGIALAASSVVAHPYATALTNDAGTVSFRLNEAGATIKIIGNGGTLTNDLGLLPYGLTVTNLTSSGMTGGVFRVVATKTGGGAPAQINYESNMLCHFEYPMAVAVNTRPASPYFGRIYVGNARGGKTTVSGRPCDDGIYILNADTTDALGQGNTALTAGIDMAAGGGSMPWRIRVGTDEDVLYLCDWSDSAGNLWRADANMTLGSGTNVLQLLASPTAPGNATLPVTSANNHGSISEVVVTGSLDAGTLTVFTVDEDYQTDPENWSPVELNSLWKYEVGSGPLPWANPPNQKVVTPRVHYMSQTMGLDRATNGYFYLLDNRFYALVENVLQVIDPAGPTVVYHSISNSYLLGLNYDYLSNSVSVAVSPDMKYCAVMRANGRVVVLPMLNGIPSLEGRLEFSTGMSSSCRQIAFDAADNLYLISSSKERLRIFSLGLTTTAITGSDGTFGLSMPDTTVSVSVNTNLVYETGDTNALFTLTRTGATNSPLAVPFFMNGTATWVADYILLTNAVVLTTNVVVIPAGASNVSLTLSAISETAAEFTETATLHVTGSPIHSAGVPFIASVDIGDTTTPSIDIAVVYASMYERLSSDYARFQLTRRGDLSVPLSVNFNWTGTAPAARYTTPADVSVDAGVRNQDFDISPVDDTLLRGDETIVCTVAPGVGYNVGTNSPSANAVIIEDELPPETVLFSEDFNADHSAAWTPRFGSGNGVEDYLVEFLHDYGSGSWICPIPLPPAPHSTADTLGLCLTVNKTDDTPGGAAGLNLYSSGMTFAGNFAVRFDMYLMAGALSPATTEYALFGINHGGDCTNWFRYNIGGVPAGWNFDGLWFGVEADGAALGDYVIYSAPTTPGNNPTPLTPGVNASSLGGIFKAPPFGFAGAPANREDSLTPSWVDVELSQIGRLITLKINNTVIMRYTNTTAFTNGQIMLGYCDAYDSIQWGNAGVIYDNLRVISVDLKITTARLSGGNCEIAFVWDTDDPPTVFRLQSAPEITGPFADEPFAVITRLSPGRYAAAIPATAPMQFYKLRYAGP